MPVAKKKPVEKKSEPKSEKKLVGKITHFFDKISVAVVEVSSPIKLGDKLLFEGHNTSFEQDVKSMQIEHEQIKEAKKSQSIGMKLNSPAKPGCLVYKV